MTLATTKKTTDNNPMNPDFDYASYEKEVVAGTSETGHARNISNFLPLVN